MICKKVKQFHAELEFNPCKKVVQQLGQETVPCGSDFFCPCKKTACAAKSPTWWCFYCSLCCDFCLKKMLVFLTACAPELCQCEGWLLPNLLQAGMCELPQSLWTYGLLPALWTLFWSRLGSAHVFSPPAGWRRSCPGRGPWLACATCICTNTLAPCVRSSCCMVAWRKSWRDHNRGTLRVEGTLWEIPGIAWRHLKEQPLKSSYLYKWGSRDFYLTVSILQ